MAEQEKQEAPPGTGGGGDAGAPPAKRESQAGRRKSQRHDRTVTRFCEEAQLQDAEQLDLAEFIVAAQYLGADASEKELMRVFVDMEMNDEQIGKTPKQVIKELMAKVETEKDIANSTLAEDGPMIDENTEENYKNENNNDKIKKANTIEHEILSDPIDLPEHMKEDLEWQEVHFDSFLLDAGKDQKLKIAKNLLLSTALSKEQVAEITGVDVQLLEDYDSDEYETDDDADDDEEEDEEDDVSKHVKTETLVPLGNAHEAQGSVVIESKDLNKKLILTKADLFTLDELIKGGKKAVTEKPDESVELLKKLRAAVQLTPQGLKHTKTMTKLKKLKTKAKLEVGAGDDAKENEAKPEKFPRKYRVVVVPGALVKAEEAIQSKPVGKITTGTVVTVEEIRGRRARISEPTAGWVSVIAKDERVVLEKLSANTPEMQGAENAERSKKAKILILKSITTLNEGTCQKILEKSEWNMRRAIEAYFIAKYRTMEYVKGQKKNEKGGKKRGSILQPKTWWNSWKKYSEKEADRMPPPTSGS